MLVLASRDLKNENLSIHLTLNYIRGSMLVSTGLPETPGYFSKILKSVTMGYKLVLTLSYDRFEVNIIGNLVVVLNHDWFEVNIIPRQY